ncbi:MAG TPA: helix-turn-helix transcriptional regulator [Solirubrobacteraceae bacterium]|nr:helix-turn-helix transcriptional regulator [Solirubrobacteraceae bacterium]
MPKRTQKPDDLALLGKAIRQLRDERRLSQGELAVATGVGERRIQALEAGRLDPDYMLLLALAKALGVRAGALVIRAEELARQDVESEDAVEDEPG